MGCITNVYRDEVASSELNSIKDELVQDIEKSEPNDVVSLIRRYRVLYKIIIS